MPTEAQNRFVSEVLQLDAASLPPPGASAGPPPRASAAAPPGAGAAPPGAHAAPGAAYPTFDPVAAAKLKARLKAQHDAEFEHLKHARLEKTGDGTNRQRPDFDGFIAPKPPAAPAAPQPTPNAAPPAPEQAAPPPSRRPAYDAVAAAAHLEKSRAAAIEKMQELDAIIDRDMAELEALKAKLGERPKRAGGTMPSFAELLNDTGPAMAAMQHLDLAKAKQWVVFNGKQTDTKDVLKVYTTEAVKMSGAMGQIVARNLRDLKHILAGHGSGDGRDEVLGKVSRQLPAAGKLAETATAFFLHQPPEFEKGMHALTSALRLNQLTSELVQDWSQGAIENAQANIDIIRNTRNVAIAATTAVFIAAAAPGVLLTVGITAATGGAKLVISATDFMQEGKPVPWGELTASLVLEIVGGTVAKGLESLCKPAIAAVLASKRGQALIARGFTETKLAHVCLELAKETIGVGSEFVKKLAENLWKERPKEDAALASYQYFWKVICARFESKEVAELLVGRLTDHLASPAGEHLRPKTS